MLQYINISMWLTQVLVLSQLCIVLTVAFPTGQDRKFVEPAKSGDSPQRFKRADDAASNRVDQLWADKQKDIEKLKELSVLRGETINFPSQEDNNGYASLAMKWLSNWSLGPIERRLYRLSDGPRHRFGYSISFNYPGRLDRYNTGYYKDYKLSRNPS